MVVALLSIISIISISTLLIEVVILLTLGLLLALLFVCIGVWPALVTSLGICGISIIRLPWMIYHHASFTYKTALLRPHVKLISFLIMPLVHLLIPPASYFGLCFVTSSGSRPSSWLAFYEAMAEDP